MTAVDLMPAAVRSRQARRRRVRHWVTAAISSACLGAIPVSLELVNRHRLDDLEHRRRGVEQEMASTEQALQQTEAGARKYSDQIIQADALRTKRSWAGLLQMIGQSMTQRVWLTSVATKAPNERSGAEQRRRGPQGPATQNPERPDIVLEGPRHLEIVGYAVDHADLYVLMTELKERGSFLDVDLTSSGHEPTLRGSAVRFTLECRW